MSDGPATAFIDLPFQAPYQAQAAMATLAAHAIPGVEVSDVASARHTRVLADRDGPLAVTVQFADDRVTVSANADRSALMRLTPVIRRWLDLDADPQRIGRTLGTDPVLAALVALRPGLRVIGYPDGFEAAAVTVLGQQVSVAACRTFAGRLTAFSVRAVRAD